MTTATKAARDAYTAQQNAKTSAKNSTQAFHNAVAAMLGTLGRASTTRGVVSAAVAGVVVILIAVVAIATFAERRIYSDRVLPGVNVDGVTRALKTGDRVRVDGDRGVVERLPTT